MDKYDEALRRSGWRALQPGPFPPLESGEYFDLREHNKQMVTAGSDRDLNAFMIAGMNALVYTGSFYEKHKYPAPEGLYNTVSVALLSASKGDWPSAEAFTRQHLEHLDKVFKDVSTD